MRSKTPVRRPKFCRSPHPVKRFSKMRARISVPEIPEMSDDNGEDSSGSGSKSEEGDRLTVNSHDETDFRRESCDNLGPSRVSMDGGWFERKTCIKCNEVGQMLVCTVSDCPVAVHEKCLAFKPRLDDMGNFRCPYCAYKQAEEKKQELRKELMLAKKALSDFVNFKVVEDDQEKLKDRKAKGNGVNTSTLDCSDYERGVDDEERAEPSNTGCIEEETIVNVSLHMPTEGTVTADISKDKQATMEKEEQAHLEAVENTVLTTKDTGLKVPADDSEMSEASDSDTQAPLVDRRLTKQRSKMKTGCKNLDQSKKSSPQLRKTLDRSAKNQIKKEIIRKRAEQSSESLSDFVNCKVVEDDQENMKDGKAKENGVNTSTLDCSDHEKGVDDEERAEPSNTGCIEEEIIVNVSLHMPTEGTVTADISKDKQATMEKEEQAHLEAVENIVLTTKDTGLKVTAGDSEMSEASDSDTQAPLVDRALTKQRSKMKTGCKNVYPSKKSSPQLHKTLDRGAKNQIKKEIIRKRAGQSSESSYQFNVPNERRKRARWTQEEQDVLKEGVQRFSSNMNKNFPWRKVLEFGHGVFHANRTSVDLKDKWRKILAKGSTEGKNVLL